MFLNRRGQSTGEYAILFAVVLGAAVAVQNAVRNRIAFKILEEADDYVQAGADTDAAITYAAPNLQRSSDSVSAQRATMNTAQDGKLRADSEGTQIVINPE